jgi:hypothetical protein
MIALCLLLHASTPEQALQDSAQRAFDEYQFDITLSLLDELLARPLKDAALRQKAHALRAFASYYLRNEERAERDLREVFRENVDFHVDRTAFHPDLLGFFNRVRNHYLAEASVEPATAPASLPTSLPASAPAVVAPLKIVATLGDRAPWLRLFPLGVGHFANRDRLGGALFLSSELALVALNIAAAAVRASMRLPNGLYRFDAPQLGWQVVQNASAFALIGVAIFEIIDAFYWSPARARQGAP